MKGTYARRRIAEPCPKPPNNIAVALISVKS
jgi:hypothetical protein